MPARLEGATRIANLLELAGFEHESVEDVRAEALNAQSVAAGSAPAVDAIAHAQARVSVFEDHLSNSLAGGLSCPPLARTGADELQRLGEVPIYAGDAIVRRAESLQATADAGRARLAGAHPQTLSALGLADGDRVLLGSREAGSEWTLAADPALAPGVIRVAGALPESVGLGNPFGPLSVRKL